jgi:cytoskeletal protein RodZ
MQLIKERMKKEAEMEERAKEKEAKEAKKKAKDTGKTSKFVSVLVCLIKMFVHIRGKLMIWFITVKENLQVFSFCFL